MPQKYNQRQLQGSEYGGVERTTATVQPKAPEAVSTSERLRLFYLTGQETDTEALEDHRQMLGLLPADGARPKYLSHTGTQKAELEIENPELYE